MSANALSLFGRMSYGAHLCLYPIVGGTSFFLYNTYKTSADAAQAVTDAATAPKAKACDPDLFNPFTAIPFHNNKELNYRYADVRLHGYLDQNQMNLKNYTWKSYHNSFDHDDRKQYMYNWVSMVPSHNKSM